MPTFSFTLSHKPSHLNVPIAKNIDTGSNILNSAFHDSYIDEQAAMLSEAIIRQIDLIPDEVKSMLDDFYDKIMEIKLKVNELRYSYFIHARNQMDGLSDVLSDVQNRIISHSTAVTKGSDVETIIRIADQIMQQIPQYFSHCYDSVLIKVLPQRSLKYIGAIETIINSLQFKGSVEVKTNKMRLLENTLPQINDKLEDITYEIDKNVEQSHLTTAVNECIIQNGKFARHKLEVIRNKLRDDFSTNDSDMLEAPILINDIKHTGYDETINV